MVQYIKKAVSLLLALLLVIQLMPVQAMAANSGQLSSGTISAESAEAPEILGEDVTRREESAKHYRNIDDVVNTVYLIIKGERS